jgi:hypothetical protein
VTLLNASPEIQFVALKNIQLITQKHKDILTDIKVFFCKYRDPIYVKLTKLDIISQLVQESNMHVVMPELQEYATEIDVDFVRKAVRTIGRCAIKIEPFASKCVGALVELIQTKVTYVVQESVIVLRDIFRKYPSRFESVLGVLCENIESLDDAESRSAMIWMIGQYSDRIENAEELLKDFLQNFSEEPEQVQLALLTASMKLFVNRPSAGGNLAPIVLKAATQDIDNPDVRDRGFMYWRMISTDPKLAQAIILGEKPAISLDSNELDAPTLASLLYCLSTLSSLTFKPPIHLKSSLQQMLLNLHHKTVNLLKIEDRKPAKIESPAKPPKTLPKISNTYDDESLVMNVVAPVIDTSLTPGSGMGYGDLPLDLFSNTGTALPSVTEGVDLYGIQNSTSPDKTKLISKAPGKLENLLGSLADIVDPLANGSTSSPAARNTVLPSNVTNSAHNPFVSQNMGSLTSPTSTTAYIPLASNAPSTTSAHPNTTVNLDSSINVILDPFSRTSITTPAGLPEEPYQQLLSSELTNGLEVQGKCTYF